MNGFHRSLGFALTVSSALYGLAQAPTHPHAVTLELQLRPEAMERKIPEAFTIRVVNRSNHDIRIPLPALERGDVPHGTVWLRLNFKPSISGTIRPGIGGVNDYSYQSIIDRVRTWKMLGPGESLTLAKITDRVLAPEAGAYDYWAVYYPPGMPKADEDLLSKVRIDFPEHELESNHVKFVKRR